MTSNFDGLPVSLNLVDGSSLEGVVRSVDPVQGQITLDAVTITRNGLILSRLDTKVVSRTDVTSLKMLSVSKNSNLTTTAPIVVVNQAPVENNNNGIPELSQGTSEPKKVRRGGKARVHADIGIDRYEPAEPTRQAPQAVNMRGQDPQAQHPFEEEFDFSAGLRRFNKAQVFEDIRSQDDTDPSLRLHAHNRNRTLAKLAPNESVLSADELYQQSQQTPIPSAQPAEGSTDDNSEYEVPFPPPPPVIRTERRGTIRPSPNHGNGKSSSPSNILGKGFATTHGTKVVEVKLKQYKEAISIADIETGPTSIQRTENAARGLAHYILRTLSQPHSPKRPSICIVCDDCEKGTVALRSGVHLSNHGATVVAFILTTEDHSQTFKTGLREFSSAGGRILRDLEDLASRYDLLIDAIADNEIQSSLEPKSAAGLAAAAWASESRIPILSIDAPLGTDHDTGAPTTSSPLHPTYVACRGAVRKGCRSLGKGTEIVLLDVGISPSLWSRVGVEEFERDTFGAEFVVELKRI